MRAPGDCFQDFASPLDVPFHAPVAFSTGKDMSSSRLKFEQPPNFQALKYLSDPLLRAGFIDPGQLRLPKHARKPVKNPARVRCDKTELKNIFHLWDRVDSFMLMPAEQSEYRYCCGLFAVSKDFAYDRQILNPVPENSRSWAPNETTKSLAHASLLCAAWLKIDQRWIISSD